MTKKNKINKNEALKYSMREEGEQGKEDEEREDDYINNYY